MSSESPTETGHGRDDDKFHVGHRRHWNENQFDERGGFANAVEIVPRREHSVKKMPKHDRTRHTGVAWTRCCGVFFEGDSFLFGACGRGEGFFFSVTRAGFLGLSFYFLFGIAFFLFHRFFLELSSMCFFLFFSAPFWRGHGQWCGSASPVIPPRGEQPPYQSRPAASKHVSSERSSWLLV